MIALEAVLREFVSSCERPAVIDTGEEPLPLLPDCWSLTEWNGRAVLQAWSGGRNLVRKVTAVKTQRRDRLILLTERFPREQGEMQICDMAAPGGREVERHGSRIAFRERFRLKLARAFPGWKIEDLSAEPNLEQSLSPSYVRSMVRKTSNGVAAIGIPPDCGDPGAAVAFGLIWLDYLRKREPELSIRQLFFFVEKGREGSVQARVRWIHPDLVSCSVFVFDERERVCEAEEWSEGNLGGALPACHRPALPNTDSPGMPEMPGVDSIEQSDGSIRFQVRGLDFARWKSGYFSAGIGTKKRSNAQDVAAIARELLRVRTAGNDDRQNPLYAQCPEGWMESQVRHAPEAIDAGLCKYPLYGQVPFAQGSDRGIADVIAVDSAGRLAVLELKAAADIQLPFQALDYWAKVYRHLRAGDFEKMGYFPGVTLQRASPRIFLIAPALEFHSTSEILLSYLDPGIDITRIGVASNWRSELRVMFRLHGADRPR